MQTFESTRQLLNNHIIIPQILRLLHLESLFKRVQYRLLWWETRIAELFTDLGKVDELFGDILRCNASGKSRLPDITFLGWWNGMALLSVARKPIVRKEMRGE